MLEQLADSVQLEITPPPLPDLEKTLSVYILFIGAKPL
jgi:hypothetical protein